MLAIDYVVPDYYALRPKKCMGGWGRQFFNISPAGKILPCHAAETITGLEFESVRSNHSIAWIWQNSEAFNRYRGTGWMPEPCQSCEFKEVDFGGCRCQAFALTGDAGNTDPACTLSPMHEQIFKQAEAGGRRATATASSTAISPAARWRRAATMAPDADAGKATHNRADPFAPLTSELLPVGDGHEIYVESVGRADGIPAVYLHGGPGSGCQPDHRRLFDPERFHAVLFDQRGAGRSRPKGSREDNTLPHLIADMELIREKFGFERWMVVGGSWGATLALAYAQAHPDRVTRHRAARDLSRHPRRARSRLPRRRCRASIPASARISSSVLPPDERARPLDAYWRRILDPDPAVHGPAARAWHDTERILSEHTPGRIRLDLASLNSTRAAARHAVHGSALFPATTASCGRTSCWPRPASSTAFPASSCRAATTCCARRRPRMRLPRSGRDAEIRIVEGAGHSLYDPGVRDAVMKAIADLASKAHQIEDTS